MVNKADNISPNNVNKPYSHSEKTTSEKTPEYLDKIHIKKNAVNTPSIRNCKIEIIAAGREKGVVSQIAHYVGNKLGMGGRGEHVFTGHTGINIVRGTVSYSTGFGPRISSFTDAIKFIVSSYLDYLLGKPAKAVAGEWSSDEADLLADPKLFKFGMQVSEYVALQFQQFVEEVKAKDANYTLQPGSEVGDADVYICDQIQDLNFSKIEGKAVILTRNENNSYGTYLVENNKLVVDQEGNPIKNEITLSANENEAINSSKNVKISDNNIELKNKLISKGIERTDLAWGPDSSAKNCVNYAINVFVDFFLEYRDKSDKNGQPSFTQSEKEEIDNMLGDIVQTTSSRSYCGQTSLINNIKLWNENRSKRQEL